MDAALAVRPEHRVSGGDLKFVVEVDELPIVHLAKKIFHLARLLRAAKLLK